MAAFYADENFPLQSVEALRRLGHDALTAIEAGQANQRIADDVVLDFATRLGRAVLTLNRWEFIGLHTRTLDTLASWSARGIPMSNGRRLRSMLRYVLPRRCWGFSFESTGRPSGSLGVAVGSS